MPWIVNFAPLFSKRMGTRVGARRRRHLGAGQTDRDGDFTGDRLKSGAALSELSSGAESGAGCPRRDSNARPSD